MAASLTLLLLRARHVLDLTQSQLGPKLGSSERTSQRWERGESTPLPSQLQDLAALVYAGDPDLAGELAVQGGSTLEALGLVPPTPGPEVAHVVDSIVCAAAEAIDLSPRAVRSALSAAFTRARRLGLSLDVVEETLRAPQKPETTRKKS